MLFLFQLVEVTGITVCTTLNKEQSKPKLTELTKEMAEIIWRLNAVIRGESKDIPSIKSGLKVKTSRASPSSFIIL